VLRENIITALSQRRDSALTRESLTELARELERIGKKREDIHTVDEYQTVQIIPDARTTEDEQSPERRSIEREEIVKELYSNRHPIELVSYYSSIYFDSQLIIVQ